MGNGRVRISMITAAMVAVLVPGAPARAATGAPTAVTAVAGNGQATVSWAAPAGADVAGYTVTSSPPSPGCATGGLTTCLVHGLTNGVVYAFTVVADGSAASLPSPAVTPSGLVPYAPAGVTAAPGAAQVTVSWTPVPGATGYTATAGPSTCTTTGPSCTVTGLTDGEPYAVSVTATGPGGASAPVVLPAVVTGPPSAPRAVSLVTGVRTATVSWRPPLSAGAGVRGYRVTLDRGGLGCRVSGLSCTISGLTPGRMYTAAVVAIGVAGDSPAAVSPRVGTGLPDVSVGSRPRGRR